MAFIFENENFTYENGLRKFDSDLFQGNTRARILRYDECFNALGFKNPDEFRAMDIQLTISKWLILRGGLTNCPTN